MQEDNSLILDQLERLGTLERVCEGLTQDHIEGGWTVRGIRVHCKAVEQERDDLRSQLVELEKFGEWWKERMRTHLTIIYGAIGKSDPEGCADQTVRLDERLAPQITASYSSTKPQ
ncbi:hypothetical protein [Pseudomonas saponiphila]|nr:hypothetical protein [Pseudomonas saponiphila]